MDTLEIIRQIETDPAVRAQLRSILLGDDVLGLPAQVAALVEAQKRSENRLDRLEKAVAELVEAQKQTNQAVGRLSYVIGGTVEEDAKVLLEYVANQNGWQIIKEPAPLDINGEIDVMAVVKDASNKEFALLCEAKTRLRAADVRRFKTTVNNLPQNAEIPSDHLDYVYGLSVYPGTREAAEQMGFGLLSPRGELVKPQYHFS